MRKKIYEYLRSRPQGTESADVVRDILRIEGASPQVADDLVSGIISTDPHFTRDRQGLWHIEPRAQGGAQSLTAARFVVCVLEEEVANQRGGRRLHFQLLEGVTLRSGGQLLFADDGGGVATLDRSGKDGESSVLHFLALLNEAYMVVFRGGRIYTLLNELSLRYRGDELDCEGIEVKAVAEKLYKAPVKSIADIAGRLQIRIIDDPSPAVLTGQLAEVSCALFESCMERGIRSIDQLLEFQATSPLVIDFSRYSFDRHFVHSLPAEPGVYKIISRLGEVLYVGKARNLKRRVRCYFHDSEGENAKMELLRKYMHRVEYHIVGSELEALILEHDYITQFDPPVNKQVDVHRRKVRSRIRIDCAIFLPSAETSSVEVFFVSRRGHFMQQRCPAGTAPGERIKAIIEKLYFTANNEAPNAEDIERAELVFSWLDRYEDFVPCLHIDSAIDADDCYRLLTLHIENFGNATRLIYR